MKNLTTLALGGLAFSLSLLGGCATGQIALEDRDTTGSYDGVWIGSVGEPWASRLPEYQKFRERVMRRARTGRYMRFVEESRFELGADTVRVPDETERGQACVSS